MSTKLEDFLSVYKQYAVLESRKKLLKDEKREIREDQLCKMMNNLLLYCVNNM